MTIDEIEKMEAGREMDALIAVKIFGYRCYKTKNPFDYFKKDDKIYDMVETGTKDGFTSVENLAEYSSSITAAWLVVEKLHSTPEEYFELYYDGNNHEAWMAHVRYGNTSTGITAPLAICRAALMTILSNHV
jgi:hypothetical protein